MKSLRWKPALMGLAALGAAAWGLEWVPDEQGPARPTDRRATRPQPVEEREAEPVVERTAEPRESVEEEAPADPSRSVAWVDSLDKAFARAKKENKPVMAVFYTTWQQWWKMLEEKTLGSPEVVELSRKMINVKIDAEKSKSFAEKHKVKGYPTTIFFNAKGEETQRITGFVPPEPFALRVRDVIQGRNRMKEFQKLASSNPKEFRPLVQLAVIHLERQEYDKALATYEKALKVSPGPESREHQEVVYSMNQLYDFFKQPQKSEPLLLALLTTKTADKVKVHEMLGHLYLSLKQPQKAIEHFTAERALVEDERQGQLLDQMIEGIRKAMEQGGKPAEGGSRK